MSKRKMKNKYPHLNYTPSFDSVIQIEALRMELCDVELKIDSLRDKERYLKDEIAKLEAKLEDAED